jgi:hypothetical protein
MGFFELNKILGAVLGTCTVVVAINIVVLPSMGSQLAPLQGR